MSSPFNQLAQEYWFSKIRDFEPDGAVASPYEPVSQNAVKGIDFEFDNDLSITLHKVSGGNPLNELVISTATLAVVLLKYNYKKQFIASPYFLPQHGETDHNPIFFTLSVKNGDTFKDVIEQVKKQLRDALPHSMYDFASLSEVIEINKIGTGEDMLHFSVGITSGDTLNSIHAQKSKLLFHVSSAEGQYKLHLLHHTGVYSDQFAARAGSDFLKTLHYFLQNSNKPLSALQLLSNDQVFIASGGNKTSTALYSGTGTIVEAFEKAVAQYPHQAAVVSKDKTLTYSYVNALANQVAHCLIARHGMKKGQIIGLLTGRDEFTVIGMIGILKAGGAYLPLDINYPADRIRFMLADANVDLLLKDPSLELTGNFSSLELSINGLTGFSVQNMTLDISGDDVAYILYTSGSTGKPKGVVIEHASVINLVEGLKTQLDINDIAWRHSLTSVISFDASVKQIFIPLSMGSELHIVSDTRDINGFTRYISEAKINVVHLAPMVWSEVLEEIRMRSIPHDLKCVSSGGDTLSTDLARQMRKEFKDQVFFNTYGPTEACVNALSYTISYVAPGPVSIGRPLPNYQVYVFNDDQELLPFEVAGEICIGGKGIARGYLNNPELTHEKFIPNPYVPGTRLYRTGDLGYWMSPEKLQFIGRIDSQVKIRGYRIEPTEIEIVLKTYESIEEAKVVVINSKGEKQLVAFFKAKASVHASDLKSFLLVRLPEYMVPAYFQKLSSFPLMPSGKIDVKQLRSMERYTIKSDKEYEGPRNTIETHLGALWKEVLKADHDIGIHDNFFELGGHSLRAARLLSLIYRDLNVSIDIKSFYDDPTIAALSQKSDSINKKFEAIPTAAEKDLYELSHTQKRLWVLDHFDGEQLTYSVLEGKILEGIVDIRNLEKAFLALIERHESLRTTFVNYNGEPKQRINSCHEVAFRLESVDLKRQSPEDRLLSVKAATQAMLKEPFDLKQGPLLRAKLLRVEDEKYILLFSIHHIISDGWSMRNLIKEICIFYNAFVKDTQDPLPPLRLQHKDYTEWYNNKLKQGQLQEHLSYWLTKLGGGIATLELPHDFPRTSIKSNQGNTKEAVFHSDVTALLQALSRSNKVSLFSVLIALTKILLFRYSGQEDIVVGSPVAGREHSDLQDQIGFFINTVALRDQLNENNDFSKSLEDVNRTVLEALKYQAYPFDLLVQELVPEKDPTRSPIFDVMVILQNTEEVEATMRGIKLSEYKLKPVTSKFDLLLCFYEHKDSIRFDLEYNTALYTEARIDKFIMDFKALIKCVATNPHAPIGNLNFFNREPVLS